MKGIYQSLRCGEGNKLFVNADVSNAAFWRPGSLSYALLELASPAKEGDICGNLSAPGGNRTILRAQIDKLRKVRIKVKYNNMPESKCAS